MCLTENSFLEGSLPPLIPPSSSEAIMERMLSAQKVPPSQIVPTLMKAVSILHSKVAAMRQRTGQSDHSGKSILKAVISELSTNPFLSFLMLDLFTIEHKDGVNVKITESRGNATAVWPVGPFWLVKFVDNRWTSHLLKLDFFTVKHKDDVNFKTLYTIPSNDSG